MFRQKTAAVYHRCNWSHCKNRRSFNRNDGREKPNFTILRKRYGVDFMNIDDYAQNPRFRYSILQVNDTPFEQ